MDPSLVTGVTDPDPHPPEVRSDMGNDTANTVVAGMAAPGPDPNLAQGKIQLVIDHNDLARLEFVIPKSRTKGPPGVIHECLRLEHQESFPGNPARSDIGVMSGLAQGQTACGNDPVYNPEADVMPMVGVFWSRIAETRDKNHGSGQRPPWDDTLRQSRFSSSASASSSSSTSSPSSSSAITVGAATVATVKSRSVITNSTPAGKVMLLA